MAEAIQGQLIRVGVPVPLYQCFDYAVPIGMSLPLPGSRVRVPFGPRKLVGVVLGPGEQPRSARTRELIEVLDANPSLGADLLHLADWAARYYHEPIGQVLATMLPAAIRRNIDGDLQNWIALSRPLEQVLEALSPRASAQRLLAQKLAAGPLPRKGNTGAALNRLHSLGLVQACAAPAAVIARDRAPALSPQQAAATDALSLRKGFCVDLLHGVTGSGKTEVYLHAIDRHVAASGQVLVLVPEIALTPQLLQRFQERYGHAVATYHSGLGAAERARTWSAVSQGKLSIVIGTRSAVFLPMPSLAAIIVDEEHDASFKQQEGFRYHARDLAVVRARHLQLPVLLGSATPSLESLANAQSGRYGWLRMPERVNQRPMPRVRLLDVRNQRLNDGLSEPLLQACGRHLAEGNQVLLFINRRGFAPVLLCHACGWIAPCERCDARMTVHKRRGRLSCHHCGAERPMPSACPKCQDGALLHVGEGTQRIEQALRARFPERRIERVDSDRLRERGALDALLAETRSGAIDVLVGTQILAKGHDFHRLTLVGVVNVDQALYGSDFRALERMGQLVMQVAGRAGRGEHAGEVLLQTHEPEHPMLRCLSERGHEGLCEELLPQRRQARLPPCGHLALLRAESADPGMPAKFLNEAAQAMRVNGVDKLGPAPAPMERLAGRSRAQLLLRADRRADLQRALSAWVPELAALPSARRVRWSIDVDPVDLF